MIHYAESPKSIYFRTVVLHQFNNRMLMLTVIVRS